MDVLSLGKGLKAKKAAQAVSNRLGVDQTKNGPLGIVDVHENVSKRLDALEEKLKGKTITPIVLATQEDWKKGTVTGMTITANGLSGKGVWETTIQLPVDAVALDKIILEGTNVGIVEIRTKTNEDYQLTKAGGVIASTFGHAITIKLTSFATTPVIQKLTLTYVTRPMNERLSDLSVHTAINLNKQHLRLSTVLETERYQLTNTVIDDFQDATGIDTTRSSGIVHDPLLHKVGHDGLIDKAEVYLVNEKTDTVPKQLFLSYVSNDRMTKKIPIDLQKGTFIQSEWVSDSIQLEKLNDTYFKEEGEWMSEIIEFPDNLIAPPRIQFMIDENRNAENEKERTTINLWIATSENGIQFSEYELLPENGFLLSKSKFIQIKAKLKSSGEVTTIPFIEFKEDKRDVYEINELIVFKEGMHLQDKKVFPSSFDSSYHEHGFVYRIPWNGYSIMQIEKLFWRNNND